MLNVNGINVKSFSALQRLVPENVEPKYHTITHLNRKRKSISGQVKNPAGQIPDAPNEPHEPPHHWNMFVLLYGDSCNRFFVWTHA